MAEKPSPKVFINISYTVLPYYKWLCIIASQKKKKKKEKGKHKQQLISTPSEIVIVKDVTQLVKPYST